MGEVSKIEWTDATFNPWVGCTKVSPACDHCYAEGWAKRAGSPELWQGERRRTTAANWRVPLKLNAKAVAEGRRIRVFCASLADVFDNQVPDEWRHDLFTLIDETPMLDWQLLTKRPQNVAKMLARSQWGGLPGNVWLGTTVENQTEAGRRIPHLLSVPAAVHFLSCEPLLGPVDLCKIRVDGQTEGYTDALTGGFSDPDAGQHEDDDEAWVNVFGAAAIDWVITGGESGGGSRPTHPDWFRALRDQCAAAGVPFLFKQWGDWKALEGSDGFWPTDGGHCIRLDGWPLQRVGRKHAGRLLDGVDHREFPL